MSYTQKIKKTEIQKPGNELYYFPHHLVISEFNTIIRFRVVFNGKTKNYK